MSAEVARALLHLLLDRLEQSPDRKRLPAASPPESFADAAAREAFGQILEDARRAGAVEVQRGKRELRHLIQRVTLADSASLRRFLGRMPSDRIAASLVDELQMQLPDLDPETVDALNALQAGWVLQRKPFGVPPELKAARAFLVALDAVLRRDPLDRHDLRTFSRKATGDSKLIERQRGPLVAWMKTKGRVPPELSGEELLAAVGLVKCAHPVLVAGPVQVRGADMSRLAYCGIAPEDVNGVDLAGAMASLLIIENFASFNRHVHEARGDAEIVVYSGGFPSRVVLQMIRRLVEVFGVQAWHWGDIDAGGVKIADHIARQAAPGLRLHLMTPDLARRFGTRAPPEPALAALSSASEVASLGKFLAEEGAAHLEQEEIDPAPVAVAIPGRSVSSDERVDGEG
ncbi:DUF2399 domain-containing protein [Roseomonas hellenica]|uniref:DUF2399 domain-containing protein n=1 Tax=Plastoroseomonas hellenica TaxID=2687306 RepID=A0ABS5F7F9_9PROT|nr:Wadjet anti-phage system protein JetD domain-containing protein [Plastoroseomonas hellenica]MBR0668511.1 DUF2399 domain-containing protein [Plastoroseomonas hellenica]